MRNRKPAPHDSNWNFYSTPHQDAILYAPKRRKRQRRYDLTAASKARLHESRVTARKARMELLHAEQQRILDAAMAR